MHKLNAKKYILQFNAFNMEFCIDRLDWYEKKEYFLLFSFCYF